MQVVVFLILALNYASAQSEGDFCACQPSSYTITLDFGLECDDSDITTGLPGIEGAACLLRTTTGVAGEIPEDPFPLSVISIEITELDQVNEPINQVNYTEIFLDGGSIVFDSVTLTDSAVLPRTFQAILVGANAAGEELVNTIVILFTQSCTDYPVLTDGMQIGWLVFVSARNAVDGIPFSLV